MHGAPSDLYRLLGVGPDASPEAIDAAYRELSSRHHPSRRRGDRGAEARFKRIVAAYAVLGDRDRRARYDRDGVALAGGGAMGDLFGGTPADRPAAPVFVPVGDHLEVEVPLTVVEALRGAEIDVPTLDGAVRLRIPGGTTHGTLRRLRGAGPTLPGGTGRGDIRYRFVLELPGPLTDEQARALDRLAATLDNPRERAEGWAAAADDVSR